jgi:hypothetical protein
MTSPIGRANSGAKLFRDLRLGTALLAEHGNVANVDGSVMSSEPHALRLLVTSFLVFAVQVTF